MYGVGGDGGCGGLGGSGGLGGGGGLVGGGVLSTGGGVGCSCSGSGGVVVVALVVSWALVVDGSTGVTAARGIPIATSSGATCCGCSSRSTTMREYG